ncbi:hypothetical protein phytr_9370 [Candidatus Phycorickettsia trachydisci]|uniref:CvpA family protein n=1 Tax=Candidatus Phycorickettsia trachydisci TaxID=2115978 RepID=A0A2P1P9D2_9RICK|nr:CvpA family protein [Candidatus Phycorickettsia trachydisci]AVP87865.1 hypothetical protein phytr_9370 [Candidatus Phycorickettsia trachydisci]
MLNLLDAISGSIMISCCLSGFYKGAIRLILANLIFIFAFFLAGILFPSTHSIASEYISSNFIVNILAGGISYIISLILCSIFFRQIKSIINPICGGSFDKAFGLILGIINGAVISILLFLSISFALYKYDHKASFDNLHQFVDISLKEKGPKWLEKSYSASVTKPLVQTIITKPWAKDALKKVHLDIGKKEDKSLKEQLDEVLEK